MLANTSNTMSKYRVIAEIADGDFGRTYRGEDTTRKDSIVAIKLLQPVSPGSAHPENTFLKEVQFLRLLKHPYILPVLDMGFDRQIPYIVTEYAPNGSLQVRLKQAAPRPLPVQEVLSILGRIGQALHHTHQQNILHRDLKPTNILFTANGDAILGDFGIPTMLAAGIKYGRAMNTALYMAPEQFRGTFSKQGDQYALGCIAYELLTGRVPFTATDFFSLGYKHSTETPIPPSQLNLLLPHSIEQAILKAMEKLPDDRHPDMATFLTALGVPLAASQPTSPSIDARVSPSVYDRDETLSSSPSTHRQMFREETGKMIAFTALASKTPTDTPPSVVVPVKETNILPTSADASVETSRKKLWLLKHKWLTATIVVLVLLLISGGVLYAMSTTPHTTATVTIALPHTNLSSTYTIYAVTDEPDASLHQVQARLLSSTSQTLTKTVQATGQGTTSASAATGTLSMSNSQSSPQTVPANTSIPNITNKLVFVTDAQVTVPAANGTQPGTAKVSAHALQAGTSGNVASGNIHTTCCNNGIDVSNPSAFSGGADAKNYPVVQQSDQYNAASPLEGILTQNAQSSLNAQIHSNEKLVGSPDCAPTIYYSNAVGSPAAYITATVSVTCTGEVYDQQGAQAMAASELKSNKSFPSSASYIRVGQVTTTVTQATVDAKGMVSLLIKAMSTQSFLLSNAQKHNLASLIAGKSEKSAYVILQKQMGMNAIIVKLSGGDGHTLPTDPNRITITTSN